MDEQWMENYIVIGEHPYIENCKLIRPKLITKLLFELWTGNTVAIRDTIGECIIWDDIELG